MFIPTPEKIAVLDALAEAGFKTIEVTSFVSPKAIPQMADAAEVMEDFKRKHGSIEAVALVPNVKGAEKALLAGADTLNFVLSASESHNRENTRRTIEESLSELAEVCRIARASPGKKVHVSVATAFYCPFEGEIPKEAVLRILDRVLALGCGGVSIADTIGTAHPVKVHDTLAAVRERCPKERIVLHLHDTQGMALVNVLTALRLGYSAFDAAVGGLGGCPFAPGAAGNAATEDVVNFLERLGIGTGIDLEKVLAVARGIPEKLGVPLCSHMAAARPCKE
jgi:hydroxymethylglutaryl-CoA lyase